MSNCIWATTRPKSGTKRPKTPASFIQRSTVSGSRSEVSTSRNRRFASRIGAHGRVDQLGMARGGAHRQRMDFQPVFVGQREHPDQPDRIGREEIVVRHGEPAAVEQEAFELARPAAEAGQAEAAAASGELLVEMGEEDAGQVADRFRVQEIVAHEALDRALSRPVGIMHPRRDLALIVEGQPLLGAAGDQVEMAAHRPEEALGALELAQLGRREQADVDQLGDAAHPIGIFADPEERVQIPEAAFALLDVGLDDIAAVAHPFVPRVALVELLLDEAGDLAGDDLLPEARLRPGRTSASSPQT